MVFTMFCMQTSSLPTVPSRFCMRFSGTLPGQAKAGPCVSHQVNNRFQVWTSAPVCQTQPLVLHHRCNKRVLRETILYAHDFVLSFVNKNVPPHSPIYSSHIIAPNPPPFCLSFHYAPGHTLSRPASLACRPARTFISYRTTLFLLKMSARPRYSECLDSKSVVAPDCVPAHPAPMLPVCSDPGIG